MYKFGTLLFVADVLLYFFAADYARSAPAPDITSLEIITLCSDLQCVDTTGLYSATLPGSILTNATVKQISYSSYNTLTYNSATIPLNSSQTLVQNSIVVGFLYQYILSGGTSGTLTATARSTNNNQLWTDSLYITLKPTLTITKLGTGSGTVTPDSGSLTWNGNIGTGIYTANTQLTLLPTASTGSSFDGWSGACTNSSGPCNITMDSNKTVFATFIVIPNAKIGSTYYGTLSNAYNAVTVDGVIEAKDMTFTEDLTLHRDISFTLAGGYADDYGSRTGFTTLGGILTISSGSMIVDSLIIQ